MIDASTYIRARFLTVLVAGNCGACIPASADLAPCKAGLLPGDLVITEIMANPAGDDSIGEWIELYNATGLPIELAGTILIAGQEDGSDERSHIVSQKDGGPIIPAGEYLVVAPGTMAGAAPHAQYEYGDDLGQLADEAGRVALKCDVIEIDAVAYNAMPDGVAYGLSAAVAPDYLINDDPGKWCLSATEYASGSFGTPGAANDCAAGAISGTCNARGTRRPLAIPEPGDLVITEVMPNPDAVSDTDGEWIELYATRDVDLNGLALARAPGGEPEQVLDAEDCLQIAAGAYAVLAKNHDPAANGGLDRVDHTLELSMANSGGYLAITTGTTLLDEITWPSAAAGVSAALDPDFIDPTSNDDPSYWCADDESIFGHGDRGTPGQRNRECAIVLPGMCQDGNTLRPIESPGPGQVTITEYMANPSSVSDTTGEWIEARFDTDVDLNELELGREPGSVLATIESTQCLRVAAGTHVIFARNADPASNGGLPQVDAELGFALVNSNGGLFLGIDDEVLGSLTYESSTAGASTSLDENDGITWCPNQTNLYGTDGNAGTPGAANPPCAME